MLLFYFLGLATFLLGLVVGYGLALRSNDDIEQSLNNQSDKIVEMESVLVELVSANNSNANLLDQTAQRLQAWIEIQRAEIPMESPD